MCIFSGRLGFSWEKSTRGKTASSKEREKEEEGWMVTIVSIAWWIVDLLVSSLFFEHKFNLYMYFYFFFNLRWFSYGTNQSTGKEDWLFKGEYWKKDWSKCPDIFWGWLQCLPLKKKSWHLSVNIPCGYYHEPNHNPNTKDGCQSLNEEGHWIVELVQMSGF